MAEAAKSARTAFGSIGDSARSGGERAASGMLNTRAALGILDNSIRGAHAQAMADLIRLFAQSSIVMAALPLAATAGAFLLIGGGVVALAEKIHQLRDEHEKLGRAMTDFGTAAQNSFNSLDEKILQSEARADELRNDHLGALAHQLQLIDMQSMSDLERTFDDLAKKTDVVFGELKSHWYTFGIGADGAKHALEVFQSQYESLLSGGKEGAASSLLQGTAKDAEHVLAMQRQARDNSGSGLFGGPKAGADVSLAMRAELELHKAGVGYTEKEIQAQETLVQALQAQEAIEQRVAQLKKDDGDNAKRTTAGQMSAEHSAGAKAGVAARLQMGEQILAAEKAVAAARLTVQRASIAAREQNDLAFAEREYQMQLAANNEQMKALDKYAKDYPNQLKELHNKALEIEQEHATAVATITSKAQIEQNAKDLADLEQGERDKIDATRQGSSERLAAIDAALDEERNKNMQDLGVYRQLLTERVNVAREMAQEERTQRETAANEAANQKEAMDMMGLSAAKAAQALQNSAHHASQQALLDQAVTFANQEAAIKLAAEQSKAIALDKSDKDYENKLKANLDKQKQIIQENANETAALRESAEKRTNDAISSANQRFLSSLNSQLTSVLTRHQTFGAMMVNMGNQVVNGAIQNALQLETVNGRQRFDYARTAAAAAFNNGEKAGFPIGLVLGPVMGAATFAAVMAFAGGTDMVPGVGRGDVVPAMLTPGEGVVPGGVMDNLRSMARHGNMGSGNHTTVHIHQTNHISTIDGDGMTDVLDKHADQLQKHFQNSVRKMNR